MCRHRQVGRHIHLACIHLACFSPLSLHSTYIYLRIYTYLYTHIIINIHTHAHTHLAPDAWWWLGLVAVRPFRFILIIPCTTTECYFHFRRDCGKNLFRKKILRNQWWRHRCRHFLIIIKLFVRHTHTHTHTHICTYISRSKGGRQRGCTHTNTHQHTQ